MPAEAGPGAGVVEAAPPARPFHAGLQAVRGLAALLVFLQHTFAFANVAVEGPLDAVNRLNLGGVGIYLFFALSAFLMLERSQDPPGRFIVDRLRRIYPTLWLSLLVVAPITRYINGVYGVRWTTVLLVPTPVPAHVTVPFWSLSFEMALYLLVWLAMLVHARLVAPVVLAWCAVGMVFHPLPYDPIGHAIFPETLPFFVTVFGYFFAAGILARMVHRPRPWVVWPSLAAAVLLYLANQSGAFYGWLAVVLPAESLPRASFATAALMTFCVIVGAASWTPRAWPARLLVRLGDVSYGVYLFHMGMMLPVAVLLKAIGLTSSYWVAAAIIAAVALPLSAAFGVLDLRLQVRLKAWTRGRSSAAIVRRAPRLAN